MYPDEVTKSCPPNLPQFDHLRTTKQRKAMSPRNSVASIDKDDLPPVPIEHTSACAVDPVTRTALVDSSACRHNNLNILTIASSDPPLAYRKHEDLDINFWPITGVLHQLQKKKPLANFTGLVDTLHRHGIYYLDNVTQVLLKRMKADIEAGRVAEATLKTFYEFAIHRLMAFRDGKVDNNAKENITPSREAQPKAGPSCLGANANVKTEVKAEGELGSWYNGDVIKID